MIQHFKTFSIDTKIKRGISLPIICLCPLMIIRIELTNDDFKVCRWIFSFLFHTFLFFFVVVKVWLNAILEASRRRTRERENQPIYLYINAYVTLIQFYLLPLSSYKVLISIYIHFINMGKSNSKALFTQWDLDRFSNVTGIEIFIN